MKKFETKKQEILEDLQQRILLNNAIIKEHPEHKTKDFERKMKSIYLAFENADLYTKIIMIAAANEFIDAIETSFRSDKFNEYLFINYPRAYWHEVAGLVENENGILMTDEKLRNATNKNFICLLKFESVINKFGFTMDDLLSISGKPYTQETRDCFMQKVNNLYETEIPMSDEIERINSIKTNEFTSKDYLLYTLSRMKTKYNMESYVEYYLEMKKHISEESKKSR